MGWRSEARRLRTRGRLPRLTGRGRQALPDRHQRGGGHPPERGGRPVGGRVLASRKGNANARTAMTKDRPTWLGRPIRLGQARTGENAGTGRPSAIRLPSESLNHAPFVPPKSATPLTVLSIGVSYSSNLTPLAWRSLTFCSRSSPSIASCVCVPEGSPLRGKPPKPVPACSTNISPPAFSCLGVSPSLSR